MNLNALLHDKRVAFAAAGGLLGLFVYLRHRASSASTSTSSTTSSNGLAVPTDASGGLVGNADTTGSDLASQLGQLAQQQQSALDSFQQQLTSGLSGLTSGQTGSPSSPSTAVPTAGTPTTPATTAPTTKPAPASTPATKPAAPAKYETVTAGQNWTTIEAANHLTATQARQLNGGSLNRLVAGERVRIG